MAQITLNSSGVASSGSLLLQTNGTTTQATVDTSGNLGLGVTPSAWISTFKALQVSSGAAFQGQTNSVSIAHVSGNAYVDSGGTYRYIGTGEAAQRYQQYQGAHSWYTAASGTAGNAITFTQAMTLDASGNLGIGTTSPTSKLDVKAASGGCYLATSTASTANLIGYFGINNTAQAVEIESNSTFPLRFNTNGAERARIDSSGNLLVGTTSFTNAGGGVAVASGAASENLRSSATSTGAWGHYGFYNANGRVGLISTNGTGTSYATSSDYRLKENIQPMTGALAKVELLKPCTYNWKVDGSEGEGFIAHELAEVVPGCVTGEKDAVDEEGNPVYQGIDTSFLVATLTAALQEAHGLIKDLQTRVAALES